MLRKNLPEKILLLLCLIAFFVIIFSQDKSCENNKLCSKDEIELDHNYLFGIPIDSFIVFNKKVKKNQNLSDILISCDVSYSKIDEIANKSKEIFDVRKIREGNNYSLIHSNDSIRKLCYFVYEKSPITYIVFDLLDSIHIHQGEKEVQHISKVASGEITSSLWASMQENGTNPELALELSDIYAWTIDFFGLQKGDKFKAIYEELFVDSTSIGIGKVLSAEFSHGGEKHLAIYFIQDKDADYFDGDAQSLRRQFKKAPLRFKRISSRFSNSRLHPILKIRRPHHGVDYAAPKGTPVESIGDGKVIKKGYERGGGNYIKIRHNSTYTTSYMHLWKFAKGIKKGSKIKQGQLIGYVGSSGLSTGPHLDFRFYKNGHPIDPLKVKSPAVKPVKKEKLEEFNLLKEEQIKKLNEIAAPSTLGE